MEREKNRSTTLKALIQRKGHTQASLCRAANISRRAMQYYVSGEKSPTIDVFARLCQELNCSPKTLLSEFGLDVSNIPDDLPDS